MFSKETEYALRSLVYIQVQNNKKRTPGVAEIAKEIEAPVFFTAKILQRLAKKRLLKSTRGKGGGFYFDKGNADIFLNEVVQATEGNELLTGCGFGLRECDENNHCPLHNKFYKIRERMQKLFGEVTIQSLAKESVRKKVLVNRLK
jgi:Rrf2 family protein